MKSVDLRNEKVDLSQLLHLAEEDAVLIVAQNGREFIVAEADDFDAEAEALRKSACFQSFLDRRMSEKSRVPIEGIEKEIQQELERSRAETAWRTMLSSATRTAGTTTARHTTVRCSRP